MRVKISSKRRFKGIIKRKLARAKKGEREEKKRWNKREREKAVKSMYFGEIRTNDGTHKAVGSCTVYG